MGRAFRLGAAVGFPPGVAYGAARTSRWRHNPYSTTLSWAACPLPKLTWEEMVAWFRE